MICCCGGIFTGVSIWIVWHRLVQALAWCWVFVLPPRSDSLQGEYYRGRDFCFLPPVALAIL